jgi:predicted nucleic acid-binding protein
VVAELMVGQETKTKDKFEKLETLINKLELIFLDYNLAKCAGSLVRDYPPLKLADAIVAATALSLNAKLATRNIKDFEGIKGIKGLKFFKPRS